MKFQEKSQHTTHAEKLAENLERAINLRKENKSYQEISAIINRPVGTIKRWLAPYRIKAPISAIKSKEAREKGRLTMMSNYANLRVAAYEEGKDKAEEYFKDPMFRDFINLYIGEGTKRNRSTLQIVNSDPYILFPSYLIMKKYFLKEDKEIILNIAYYENSHDIEELKTFWGEIFKNETIKMTISIQPTVKPNGHNNSNKYGLVRLSINDSYAKERLDAYIDYLKAEWMAALEKEVGCKVIMDKK